MRELAATLVLALSLVYVPLVLAAGPTVTNTAPSSVTMVRPVPPAPLPVVPTCGLGQVNPFPTLGNPGSTAFQPGGPCNPFNDPHPMLPWGDGQIGGVRYGQVIKYWQQHPQTVDNVIFLAPPAEEATPPQTEPEPQDQPGTPQGALDVKVARQPAPQSVTVPGSWIVETTRGYVHLPRWVLQELGGGRYQWALVGAWFQPR